MRVAVVEKFLERGVKVYAVGMVGASEIVYRRHHGTRRKSKQDCIAV